MDSARLIADESIAVPDRGNEPEKQKASKADEFNWRRAALIPIALGCKMTSG